MSERMAGVFHLEAGATIGRPRSVPSARMSRRSALSAAAKISEKVGNGWMVSREHVERNAGADRQRGLLLPFARFGPERVRARDATAVAEQGHQGNPTIHRNLVTPYSLTTHIDPQTQDNLANFWPLAQLFNTYILATDGDILLLIDQHAAHERINYEDLLTKFRATKQSSQALLIPLPMEFTLQEEQVILEHLWILNEMGFILEQFGSRTYLLRGVPVQTGSFQADSLLRQFIEEILLKNSTPSFDKLLEEWIYLLACKESIKAQDTLSLLQMEQLIAQLGQTQNPYTCPHGRPTMVKMTRPELERRFYRT